MPRFWFAAGLLATVMSTARADGSAIPSAGEKGSPLELPADLALIPGNAAGFVAVRPADFAKSPVGDLLRVGLDGLKPGEFDEFEARFPFAPSAVQRVVAFFPTAETLIDPIPDGSPVFNSAVVAVTLGKPFDADAVRKGLFPNGRSKAYRGATYWFDEDTWSAVIVLPGNRTFVAGSEDAIVGVLDRAEKKPVVGPLTETRAEALKHTAVAAFAAAAAFPQAVPGPFQPIADAKRIVVSLDLGKDLSVSGRLEFGTEAEAEAGETAVKAVVLMMRDGFKGLMKQVENEDAPPPVAGKLPFKEYPKAFGKLFASGFARRVDKFLETQPIVRAGTTVSTTVKDFPSGSAVSAVIVSIAAITALGENANRTFANVAKAIGEPKGPTPEEARLGKVAAAFAAYHADKGHYPPAATFAKDGTPLHSWRVALLPYMGEPEAALHKQFKLDEPWDSLHNKKLLARMPEAYSKPWIYPKNHGKTTTQVITGPGAVFDGKAIVKKADLANKGANTILAVEANENGDTKVYWSKPADLRYLDGTVPGLFGSQSADGRIYRVGGRAWVVFADGTTKELTKNADERRLKSLVPLRPSDD